MKPRLIGFIWYKEEQYSEVLEVCEDGCHLPDNYADFEERAQNGFDALKMKGAPVVKIEADIDQLKEWCISNGYRVDSEGRLAYSHYRCAAMQGG